MAANIRSAFVLLLTLLLSMVQAEHVAPFVIEGRVERRGSPIEFHQVKISVNSGEYTGLVDLNGNFRIQVAQSGLHKLEVYHRYFFFEPVVLEIFEEDFTPGKNIKSYLFSMSDGKDFRLRYPLELEPSSRIAYFEEKAAFDPLVYIKNPFVLMIGFSLVMSQMMKGMDKDDMKNA